jgi:hypothetical protein
MAEIKCPPDQHSEFDALNSLLDLLLQDVSNAIAVDVEQDLKIAELQPIIDALAPASLDEYNKLAAELAVQVEAGDLTRYHWYFYENGIKQKVEKDPQKATDARAASLAALIQAQSNCAEVTGVIMPAITELFSQASALFNGLQDRIIDLADTRMMHTDSGPANDGGTWSIGTENANWKWNALLHLVEPWWKLCTFNGAYPMISVGFFGGSYDFWDGGQGGYRTFITFLKDGRVNMARTKVSLNPQKAITDLTEDSTLEEVLAVAKEIKRDMRSEYS